MQPDVTPSGPAADSAAIGESKWATLDGVGSYVIAAFILSGGMFVPLRLAVYALFLR